MFLLGIWQNFESLVSAGELKIILSLVTSLEPREQRLLFKGKEREDSEYLHMVGVRDKDKVLLLEDPAIKDKKNNLLGQSIDKPCRTISVWLINQAIVLNHSYGQIQLWSDLNIICNIVVVNYNLKIWIE